MKCQWHSQMYTCDFTLLLKLFNFPILVNLVRFQQYFNTKIIFAIFATLGIFSGPYDISYNFPKS